MLETIKISPYNKAVLHPWTKRLIALAFLATVSSSPVPAVGAEQVTTTQNAKDGKVPTSIITNKDIVIALEASPNVPQESQDLANNFLIQTLPQLLADDDRIGKRLGFGNTVGNPTSIDRALPLMLLRREALLKLGDLVKLGKTPDFIGLVNNPNNWRKDAAARLVPNRIIFSLKTNNGASDIDPYSWSSVTVEQIQEGSWRIIQVGAPNLSRAMRQYEDPGVNHFLVWVTDLNRHYLGQISGGGDLRNLKITLTALFDDRFVKEGEHIRKAGDKFEITSKEFILRIKELYEELQFPQKARRQGAAKISPLQGPEALPPTGR